MKINKQMVFREVAGEYLLVPAGGSVISTNGIFMLTETAAYIWKILPEVSDESEIITKITEEISKVATCIDLIENRITSEVKVLNAKIDDLDQGLPKDKHVMHSKQFTDRLKLGPQLHKTLNSYRTRINADHIFIGSFHNGNESITGIPYYKFDIIAERFKPEKIENDVEFASLYKDSDLIIHDLLPMEVVQQGLVHFVINEDNSSALTDIDDILYRRMLGRGVKQLAISLTRDPEGTPSGFVGCVRYDYENIEDIYGEIESINLNEYTIIATGPLTSNSLCQFIKKEFGLDDFYFFDAQAPIITKDSIDMNICYLKSRYDKGEAAYINCPMSEEEFNVFYNELINARSAELHDFDCDLKVFEGCMPVEVMAKRGRQTLLFGPLKPKGLAREGYPKPYAVVQLRQDDAEQTLYNLVGFQTHLAFSEQKRVFSLIPGLANANFVKYGRMHKNTYINAPEIINATYQSKKYPKVFFAGQITGVEGYVESSASGIYAAINMLRLLNNEELVIFPKETIMGSMANYISIKNENFQPMNANFGIVPEVISEKKVKKKDRKLYYGQRAIDTMKEFIEKCKIKI